MLKRRIDDVHTAPARGRPSKRLRPNRPDIFSNLSDELILRTLSFLLLPDLVVCERTSKRIRSLATDAQIWKALYYERFVRPRASRIPGLRTHNEGGGALHYSSRLSRWLDDERLVKDGAMTNWKRQYRLRHNWSRGSAQVRETEVANQPSTPPLLVRLHEDVIVIADREHGLRALTLGKEHHLIASQPLCTGDQTESSAPTSLAIDTNAKHRHRMLVVIGFANGAFSLFKLSKSAGEFKRQHSHPPSSAGEMAAIACSAPFLLTISHDSKLSLYSFESDLSDSDRMPPPRLLSSMKSHTAHGPTSLALRSTASRLIASIAFAVPSYMPKWTVGIQELHLASDGSIIDSRVAFAAQPQRRTAYGAAHVDMLTVLPLPSSRPASLSYNHPYLLTAHPDNTLTLYMVTSTGDKLDISSGTILWGHTSSISSAHVGDRGKAVSVSTRGSELRVWELEGRGMPSRLRERDPSTQSSVRVQAEGSGKFDLSVGGSHVTQSAIETAKGWITFDEEKVVFLREKTHGAQALVVYDFT